MTIKEFIEIAGKEKNKKMSVILETKKYLPIAEKRALAQQVLDACTEEENGIIVVDSVTKYIIFTMIVIGAYTNLEFATLDDYDALCEAELLNGVIETFAAEYSRVNDIMNMMLADLMQTNNVETAVMGVLNKVNNGMDALIEVLADKIEEMNFNLDGVNPDMIDGVMKFLGSSQK